MISSASRKLVKIGPGRNSSLRRPVAGSSSMMSMPVMSDGIRSGVNWMRRNSRSSVRARVRAIRVLPSPGTPEQENMTATEQADQHVVDDRFLADDHLGDLFADAQFAPRTGEPRWQCLRLKARPERWAWHHELGFPSVAGLTWWIDEVHSSVDATRVSRLNVWCQRPH